MSSVAPLNSAGRTPDFNTILAEHGFTGLRRDRPRTLQVNLGKLCNQACHHCHVDAGPRRIEIMSRGTAERVVELVAASPSIEAVDLTGGAPELNPNFTYLVEQAHGSGRRIVVRCNLTVLFVTGMDDLPRIYTDHRVELVCSLPCYSVENVDRQRGHGVFDRSIEALRMLNHLGYGRGDSPLVLNLVHNPVGPSLPPPQAELEARYRAELRARFGIEFHRLLTITNMPIKRFADQLQRSGKLAEYMEVLANHFNPHTVAGVMCHNLVSVGWEGTLYDCDFNQMLELPIRWRDEPAGQPLTIWDVNNLEHLQMRKIRTASHCFGCTAGAGSSCSGALG
jgi:radical SAM/Cys-rich protein